MSMQLFFAEDRLEGLEKIRDEAKADLDAAPRDKVKQATLHTAERIYRHQYDKCAAMYDRQCDEDYRAQGASWGMSETTFDTMSGGTIVR